MYPARRRSMLYEGMHRTIIYKALFVRTSALFSLSLLSIAQLSPPRPPLAVVPTFLLCTLYIPVVHRTYVHMLYLYLVP